MTGGLAGNRDAMSDLHTKRVAFLTAPEGVERVELTTPWDAVNDAGADPVLISTRPGEVQTMDHLEKSWEMKADRTVAESSVEEFDLLLLPGGVANPDALRLDADAVAFTREFVQSGKPVAAICHAPWMLAEAGVASGRRLTSWPSLATDLRNAGADWRDEPLVVDRNLITSRNPGDLPGFTNAVLEALAHGDAGLT